MDDIFGPSGDDTESSDGTDMFNDEESSEETSETASDESSESTDEQKSEETSGTEETSSESSTEDEFANEDDSALDEEMNRLFKELEDESSSENPDENVMNDIINEMRIKAAQDETEKAFLRKQNETLQNRLLEHASKEADQGVNQPLIDKVDTNPKLRALVHLTGAADEASKGKLARILGDMYSEIT